MNETVMYAKYNQTGNKTIYDILNTMSNEERETDRGAYYGSLSGMVRHVLGGTVYFLNLFKDTLKNNANALKAVSALENISLPGEKEQLSESRWKELGVTLETVDAAYVNMTEALTGADASLPVKIDWYGGNPGSVPLSFMLSQLLVHNTHHRGQISQILDSLKIDNDYSGIGPEFLSG